MIDLQIEAIAAQDEMTQAALLTLNNAHAREASFLTPAKWRTLIKGAFAATCISGPAALLIAFDQDADYENPNFKWFGARLSCFVYVDRIIVAASHRGGGLASLMYRDLFRRVREAGQDKVVCEVNVIPPNPGSDAFHERMGFAEIGRAALPSNDKTVRYLAKCLEGMTVQL